MALPAPPNDSRGTRSVCMSTIAVGGLNRTAAFYQSVIGKKVIMAVTGFILSGFVLGHMIGNLQVFAGPEKLNAYARILQSLGGALWAARGAAGFGGAAHRDGGAVDDAEAGGAAASLCEEDGAGLDLRSADDDLERADCRRRFWSTICCTSRPGMRIRTSNRAMCTQRDHGVPQSGGVAVLHGGEHLCWRFTCITACGACSNPGRGAPALYTPL
jgi:hypothetical protein